MYLVFWIKLLKLITSSQSRRREIFQAKKVQKYECTNRFQAGTSLAMPGVARVGATALSATLVALISDTVGEFGPMQMN